MNDLALPLSGLSSVGGKSVVARFDGGMLSSNSGVLALAEVEKRLRMAERLARCIDDPRCPDQVVHSLADMIGFRMNMIAAGYEDGNDANRLRRALDTFDAVHGGQQLRLFNAHHDEYGFQPIVVFD
ncbi:transposase, partial [Mesorhizobium sp. M0036]|uniref:transposase n=1 Tax=Mesorhizobium sp. M0036 TaxID=2956853 RepID=UPI003334B269